MRGLRLPLAVSAALVVAAPSVNAATVIVDAKANSSTAGTGVFSGLALTFGQLFNVTVNPDDLWNAGALPRWSNADGLIRDLLATGTDESGEAAGTLIGTDFGLYTQNGLTAPYGSLVGEIGGIYKLLGTSFSGSAWASGNLNLFYWDSNNFDNSQFVSAAIVDVSAVPEPATWGLMVVGLGLIGFAARKRQRVKVAFSF